MDALAVQRAISMNYVLTLTDAPDPRDKNAAGAALYDYNRRAVGIANRRPLAVLAFSRIRLATTDDGRGGGEAARLWPGGGRDEQLSSPAGALFGVRSQPGATAS